MGVPPEQAQCKTRALRMGELAQPPRGWRSMRRAGRLAGEFLAAPVHVASPGTSGVIGRDTPVRAGKVSQPQRHRLRRCRLVTQERARQSVDRRAVAVPQVLEF